MRLFRRAKSLSTAQREKKLKREYLLTDQLMRLIFFTNMGREGAEHYKQKMRQKKIAKRLASAAGSGMTTKDAQKMIAESIEIQKKVWSLINNKWLRSISPWHHPTQANASKSAVFVKKTPYRPNRGTERKDRSNNRRPDSRRPDRRNPRNTRGRPNSRPFPKGKKPQSGNRP